MISVAIFYVIFGSDRYLKLDVFLGLKKSLVILYLKYIFRFILIFNYIFRFIFTLNSIWVCLKKHFKLKIL